jgi:predicted transposase YdaD
MMEDLVREFIPQVLASDLDFSRLERVNTTFHIGGHSAHRRQSDVIWRLSTREGAGSDLYLLIEFQSRTDWCMAVRTQVYQGLLWQQVIDERRLDAGARLPPLLLLVLYNGERRWSGATEIGDLIALSPHSALWPWQPQVRYHLLDIGAFPSDKLAQRTSLVALLFRLEQPQTLEEFKRLLAEVHSWFQRHAGFERLQRVFTVLIRKMFESFRVKASAIEDLVEMKTNLTKLGETWKRQWRAEGLAEGRAEGKEKGRAEGRAEGKAEGKAEGWVEGKAEALVCLLVERFGASPPSVRRRIRGADLKTLERWFKRAIVAPDLRSVFNSPR